VESIIIKVNKNEKDMNQTLPKILITAPTSKAKNYAFKEWITNIRNFTYPNTEVVVFDNTNDNGENADLLNKEFKRLFGHNNGFKAIHTNIDSDSIIERMCKSHNECIEYAKNNKFRKVLHLETDIIPPLDVIERLLFHNKQVVGALYYRDEGIDRRLMIQKTIKYSEYSFANINMEQHEDISFIDGKLKKVGHVGLGCVLIDINIFQNISFRFEKGVDLHPDCFFAEDCLRYNIPIYADTSLICQHWNSSWGVYGIDYK
jgi:hypothetical protein